MNKSLSYLLNNHQYSNNSVEVESNNFGSQKMLSVIALIVWISAFKWLLF